MMDCRIVEHVFEVVDVEGTAVPRIAGNMMDGMLVGLVALWFQPAINSNLE